MKYLLPKITNCSENKDISLLHLNKTNNQDKTLLSYKKKSSFGSTQYKNKLSLLRFFFTKKSNIYFSKKRLLKSIITNIKNIHYSTENGFFVDLELVGLGFKIMPSTKINTLIFELHFSHKLYYSLPKNVSVGFENKKIILFGIDKAALINVAENIKSLRFPNTYKGKGIKYSNEIIKLKPGKQR